jgi:hypothetical protein
MEVRAMKLCRGLSAARLPGIILISTATLAWGMPSPTTRSLSLSEQQMLRGGKECPEETEHDCGGQEFCFVNPCGEPYMAPDPANPGHEYQTADCDIVQDEEIRWIDDSGKWYECDMEEGAENESHDDCTADPTFHCSEKEDCYAECDYNSDTETWFCFAFSTKVSCDFRTNYGRASGDEACEQEEE